MGGQDWNDRARAGEHVDPDALVEAVEDLPESEPVAEPERPKAGNGSNEPRTMPRMTPLSELMPKAWGRMEARAAGKERCLPIPWPDLAKLYDERSEDGRALRPGVHVLVGGTGSGKTQLALALALEAALQGHPVAYVGLELDEVGIGARLAALAWARTRWLETMSGPESTERWSVLDWPRADAGRNALQRVKHAVDGDLAALDGLDVVFGEGRGGFVVEDFEAVCRATRAKAKCSPENPGLVVLDFLQLLGANPADRDDREIRTRIARASYVANNMTRDGKLAVLLVSATARANYAELMLEGEHARPDALVGLGKESGEIEYAATSVLVIARQWGVHGARDVYLAKNRHGDTGRIWLGWNGSDFHNASDAVAKEAVKAMERVKAEKKRRKPAEPTPEAKPSPGSRPRGAGDDL